MNILTEQSVDNPKDPPRPIASLIHAPLGIFDILPVTFVVSLTALFCSQGSVRQNRNPEVDLGAANTVMGFIGKGIAIPEGRVKTFRFNTFLLVLPSARTTGQEEKSSANIVFSMKACRQEVVEARIGSYLSWSFRSPFINPTAINTEPRMAHNSTPIEVTFPLVLLSTRTTGAEEKFSAKECHQEAVKARVW